MNWRGGGFSNVMTLPRFFSGLFGIGSWVGIALLIIALAGPVLVFREKVYLTRGIDIMIVLDLSPSMAAQDVPGTSRIDSAVRTLQNFVSRRRNDPIGLVVYGSQAALRVPPTLDYPFLLQSLSQVRIGDLGEASALGTAMALGAMHLSQSSAPDKVMIVLTDGEQNSGEISSTAGAELVARQGIRMYTLGIGGDEPVPIEFIDPLTGALQRGTYQGKIDHDALSSLAQLTGGQHFPAPGPGALETVFQGIDTAERLETRVRLQVNRDPIHRRFLALGFLLIVLDVLGRRLFLREVM